MLDIKTSIIKMIHSGARGYILKDADSEQLRQAFKEVLDSGYYYNELISRKLLQSSNLLVNEESNISLMVKLSDREMEFLKLACSEKPYKIITTKMYVSERTVDGYREYFFKKN